jgi:hypothetical protein
MQAQEIKFRAAGATVSPAGNQRERLEVRPCAWVGKSLTTQDAMAGGEMDILIGSAPSVCGLDRQHIRWIADDLATAHRRHDPVLIDLGCRRTAAERSDWR